jgi:phage terminase small subunit
MVDEAHDEKLTDKQEAFITAYLVGDSRFNATRAAIAAGYSEHTAAEQGCRLLKHEKVRGRIDEYLKAAARSPEEILAELKAVALAPTSHVMQVLPAEYTDEKGVTHKAIIRQDYSAKINALKLLGQALGMFAHQVDVNVRETKTIVGVNLEDV